MVKAAPHVSWVGAGEYFNLCGLPPPYPDVDATQLLEGALDFLLWLWRDAVVRVLGVVVDRVPKEVWIPIVVLAFVRLWMGKTVGDFWRKLWFWGFIVLVVLLVLVYFWLEFGVVAPPDLPSTATTLAPSYTIP